MAKAVTLECMRSAHRQGRACYMYAFSGPSQVTIRTKTCAAHHQFCTLKRRHNMLGLSTLLSSKYRGTQVQF